MYLLGYELKFPAPFQPPVVQLEIALYLLNALQKNRPLSESDWVESWESPLTGQDELVQARESQARLSGLLDEGMEVQWDVHLGYALGWA